MGRPFKGCTAVVIQTSQKNNLTFGNLCFKKPDIVMHPGCEKDRPGPLLLGLPFLAVTPMASEGLSPGRALSPW